MVATQITLESIYCGLFPGPITAGCLSSRLTKKVVGLMYVLSTRSNILLRDCSQFAITRLLKWQVRRIIEELDSGENRSRKQHNKC